MDGVCCVRACAKVNPLLVVHGRRPDGYHELSTVLLGVGLYDDVSVRIREDGGPSRAVSAGPLATRDIPRDATNLAVRGAEAAASVLGREVTFDVHLRKSIPSRAGLGGGSSDAAAAALGALVLLTGAQHDSAVERRVAEALGEIGADCAFFLAARADGAALARGRGEAVTPIAANEPRTVALITPEIDCATPAVYGALGLPVSSGDELREAASGVDEASAHAVLGGELDAQRKALRNDLEAPAAAAFPGLSAWREMLADLDLDHFRLAGSGSSFFGIFEPESDQASVALDRLRAEAKSRGLGVRFADAVPAISPGPLLSFLPSGAPW